MSLGRVIAALEAAGVWHQVKGDEVTFRCPLPDHEDSTASAGVRWFPADGRHPVGRVALWCRACGRTRNGELLAALGLAGTDLYDDAPRRPDPSSPRAGRAPRAASAPRPSPASGKSAPPVRVPSRSTVYGFEDETGAVVARLTRFDPVTEAPGARKGFRWQHRGGPRGGWASGKPAGGVPLYRLPAVRAATAAGARVWVVEGCKNADQLAGALPAGEVATSPPDGAGAPWRAEYTAVLAGATVTVVADRDDAGYRHAADVADALRGAGAAVRVVRTPLEVERADASDHLDAGLGLDMFEDVPAEVLGAGPAQAAPAGAAPDLRLVSGPGSSSAEEKPAGKKPGKKSGKGGGGGSQARQLLQLALALYDPIWTTTGECYLVPREGPRIARPLRGGARSFSAELVAEFYERTGTVAFNYAVTDALKVLQGIAQRSTPVELANRVARHGEALVLDLGDDTGRVVLVTARGWEVVDESPVLFARTARTGALPVPERGADGLDELWRVVHVRPRDRGLAEAELVHRYFSGVSHPLPLFTGEAGSGKTSAAETLTALVDPAPAMKVSIPGDPKDWAVQIGQAYSLVLDNVSTLQQWQSDALCMAVTGGFTQYRALYTDGGLARFGGQQCIALTSVDLGAQRADLTTRLLPIELERFGEHERLSESTWAAAREESRPRVLGVLLDRAAAVLATLPRVDALGLDLPRLSDFARTCKALDLIDADRGVSADRYGEYVRLVGQQAGDIADDDEVAAAVVELVAARESAGRGPWKGTTKELLAELGRASLSRSRYWPETPIALGKRLSSVVGPLREAGVIVDRDERTSGRRLTALYRAPAAPDEGRAGSTEATPDPAPSPRADSELAPSGPCALCAVSGPGCGVDGVAEAPEPCVVCGELTRVRARCGAPRHGQCGGNADPTPEPDPPVPDASDAAERPAAPRTAPPRADGPGSGGRAAQRRSATRPAGRGARRGLHLYGVLCSEGLTVVTDRRPGPTEPLDDAAFPADLVTGCAELARRHGLEILWVHDSALGRLGRLGGAGGDEPPSGVEAWRVVDRDTAQAVTIAVPAWLDGAWCEAESGRELAAALAMFEAAVGMRPVTAPAATAGALLGMLHNRHGARPLVAPEWLPDREVTYGERPLSWARALTADEQAARWVIGVDKRAAYPSVMRDLRVGMGTPEHRPSGEWNPKVPGRHRIVNVHPAPERDPRLPDPLIGASSDWRCTETLIYAEAAGVRFDVAESYVWPDSGRPLATFSERIRGGLADLRAKRSADELGAGVALDALKETYAAVGGMLASHSREAMDNPGKLWRPDWTGTLTAKGRVNILRNLDKITARPFAGNVDELFFAVTDPDPAALGLPIGDKPGQYRPKTAAVPLPDVVEAIESCSRDRQRPGPAPLLRRLDQLGGGEH